MKYKHKVDNLQAAKQWYSAQSSSYQKACKCPGSIKQRTCSCKNK